MPLGVEHGQSWNKIGYPERKVPEVTFTVKIDEPPALTTADAPLTPSNGDVNVAAALIAHAKPDPVRVMIIDAGKCMTC